MIIYYTNLPKYMDLAFAPEKERTIALEELYKRVDSIRKAKESFTEKETEKLKSDIKPTKEIVESYKKVLWNTIELAELYVFCKKVLMLYYTNKKLKEKIGKYLSCFSDLEYAENILNEIKSRIYNADYYETMLGRLVEPYRNVIEELIFFVQKAFKVFEVEKSDEFAEEEKGFAMEDLVKEIEEEKRKK